MIKIQNRRVTDADGRTNDSQRIFIVAILLNTYDKLMANILTDFFHQRPLFIHHQKSHLAAGVIIQMCRGKVAHLNK